MAELVRRWRRLLLCVPVVLATGCASVAPAPREPSASHLGAEKPVVAQAIPKPVRRVPVLPPPEPAPPQETYTVVVNEVPVKELLFALARDASMNVDIHPAIAGNVTLNAIDQSLPQILDRISRQIDLRYEIDGRSLVIAPDAPFLRTYKIDYVNLTRDSASTVNVATAVATPGAATGSGGSGNSSSTGVTSTSKHHFWETLKETIERFVTLPDEPPRGAADSGRVIVNAESGLIAVRATSKQHDQVRAYIDQVMANVSRQVLIEATIVEVTLADGFQSGIDWSVLADAAGFSVVQGLDRLTAPSAVLLNYLDVDTGLGRINATLELLKEFGNVTVLSSPKVMAINNQTALLKVVDNEVYFQIELEEREGDENNRARTTITSTINTVPVGLLMNVTPQIDEADMVTMNVRPTVTRILRFVQDPGVAIVAQRLGLDTQVNSAVPVVQVRETETVLRVRSGQIAVLGGLMQDRIDETDAGIPGLSDIDGIGELFTSRNKSFTKTELVIFLRPTVTKNPGIDGDLAEFRAFLPENLPSMQPHWDGVGNRRRAEPEAP